MPIPNLVEELRGALKYIYERGMASEKQWMEDAISAKGSGPHAMKEGPCRGPVSRNFEPKKDRKSPSKYTKTNEQHPASNVKTKRSKMDLDEWAEEAIYLGRGAENRPRDHQSAR